VNDVSHEEMKAARLPVAFRDYCAHLLIPLNKCRHEQLYMPFKCMDERHGYEKCQYIEYVQFPVSPLLHPPHRCPTACRHLKSVKRRMDQSQ